MPEWIQVARTEECPPGTSLEITTNGRIVALFNVDGEYYALDGICPHQGGPLGKGELNGTIVTCPWHGWQFDVKCGQSLISPSLKHPCIRTRANESDIYIAFDGADDATDDDGSIN